jgi:hypothetical protein
MRNLYKVRGLNGTSFVFAEDMSHAVESYKIAEKREYDEWREENPDEWREENPDDLSEEELEEEKDMAIREEPRFVELVCTSYELIDEPKN